MQDAVINKKKIRDAFFILLRIKNIESWPDEYFKSNLLILLPDWKMP
jgi:hypothetical protein